MAVKPGLSKRPEAWREVTVEDLKAPVDNALATGPFGSSIASCFFEKDGIPVIRGNNLATDGITQLIDAGFVFVSEAKATEFRRSIVTQGDLIFTCWGTINQVGLIGKRTTYSQYIISNKQMKFTPDPKKADSLFLYYLFSGPDLQRRILDQSIGSSVPGFNLGQLRTIRLIIPSLPEQRAIASALSDVDALIGGLDRLIAKKRDLKQAAMQQLLTGKQRLPGFNGDWELKRLGDVASLHRENVIPVNFPNQLFAHYSLPAFDAGKIPTVELGSMIGSNKFRVPRDAVLVSKLNPRIPRVWAPQVVAPEAISSTEFLVLKPNEGISRNFLYVSCSSVSFCEKMEQSATGTTGSHQRINPMDALNIEFFVPPEEAEQTAIAAVLSDMDAEIAALEQRRDKTKTLKQGMMQELLTGRVRLV